MRKETKLAVVLSAAAMLVLGASLTSFAAKGWTQEGDDWFYYNNSGDLIENDWKKSGSDWYWLGDDGAMVKDQLIEDNGYYYYVNANGAMVKNTWVAIQADDSDADYNVDYRWYYFKSNGKAYQASKSPVNINGKKYMFDEEGKMLFGFVSSVPDMVDTEDDGVLEGERYFGSNDDGAMHTGWLLYTEGLDGEDYEDLGEIWFFFDKTSGKKKVNKGINGNKAQSISGKKYAFDENGVMLSEWTITATDATSSKYFSLDDDGHLQKKTWIWAIPSEELNPGDNDDGTYRWFYVNSTGELTYDQTKKINGKWYAFDTCGRMKKGLRLLDSETVNGAKLEPNMGQYMPAGFENGYDPEDLEKDYYIEFAANAAADGNYVYFFSSDEEHDGSMKTGTVKISLADGDYTFKFKKSSGVAINGIDSKKLYTYGLLQTAGDDKYKPVQTAFGNYVVGSTGNIMKAGQYGKNGDDEYLVIWKNGDENVLYVVTGDKAASVVSYLSKNGKDATDTKYADKDWDFDIAVSYYSPVEVK